MCVSLLCYCMNRRHIMSEPPSYAANAPLYCSFCFNDSSLRHDESGLGYLYSWVAQMYCTRCQVPMFYCQYCRIRRFFCVEPQLATHNKNKHLRSTLAPGLSLSLEPPSPSLGVPDLPTHPTSITLTALGVSHCTSPPGSPRTFTGSCDFDSSSDFDVGDSRDDITAESERPKTFRFSRRSNDELHSYIRSDRVEGSVGFVGAIVGRGVGDGRLSNSDFEKASFFEQEHNNKGAGLVALASRLFLL